MEHELLILIIGIEGIGKNDLAKSMLQLSDMHKTPPLKLTIQTSVRLPPQDKIHEKYDLIIVIVDQMMKSSLSVIQDLKPLRWYFVTGKICYVLLRGDHYSEVQFEVEELETLVKSFPAPVFSGSNRNPEKLQFLIKSLVAFLLKTSGSNSDFPSLPSSLLSLKPSMKLF